MINFETYITSSGVELLINGDADKTKLDSLVEGAGDLWHSSSSQGFKNCFKDLIYQTAVHWWFINDFDGGKEALSWRINPDAFVVRKEVWEQLGGFDPSFEGQQMAALDLGFNLLRVCGGIPMNVDGLFPKWEMKVEFSKVDVYKFYLKNFKKKHSYYLMFSKPFYKWFTEFSAFRKAKKEIPSHNFKRLVPRPLKGIQGNPSVSLVIPTMKRQSFTELLLEDHNVQTYLIKEAVIVDATPEEERDDKYYDPKNFNFDIKVKWQTSKGSCRARNEAIEMCTGDYILFADDDIRILPDFVENHIRLLQSYNASAANGLDIMADHLDQDLSDLRSRLDSMGEDRWRVGVSHMYSNANSIVKRTLIDKLIGNDINFDGGYGEDSDFGIRIFKMGEVLMFNPYSPNLHLKPPTGGYRVWGKQSKILGKKRKTQPWELDNPVKFIRPVPSPTITYGILKHFEPWQIKEWRRKYFFNYVFNKRKIEIPLRILRLPLKLIQFRKSVFYAKKLLELGSRYE